MRVDRIKITNFKKLKSINVSLGTITYLVGGNNSGKSSFLQAIHMAVSCAQRAAELGQQVIAESSLRYCPTGDFQQLGHGRPYENRGDGSRGMVEFIGKTNDDADASYTVELYKARNFQNIGIDRKGVYPSFGQYICDYNKLFSVYVPGLSGVAHHEEMQSYASVFRRAAGGEANLVFRNIIRLIYERGKLSELENFLCDILGQVKFQIKFDSEKDFYVEIKLSTDGESFVSVDLCGTGVIQVTQIIAYVILFQPEILLIDEPDSHLHPSLQSRLVKVFEKIIEVYNCKIIVSTHSRHLVSAAGLGAKIIWLKDGCVEAEDAHDLTKLLMDLGALDQIDSSGGDVIVCTEDRGKRAMDECVKRISTDKNIKIISYNGITNAASAVLIQEMGRLFPVPPRLIVHRDRDFLTDDELEKWGEPFVNRGIKIFCPKRPDVESYQITPEHLSVCYGVGELEARQEVERIIDELADTLRAKFKEKRRDANKKFREDGGGPTTSELWPDDVPPSIDTTLGKLVISKINDQFPKKFGSRKDLSSVPSAALTLELDECIKEMK